MKTRQYTKIVLLGSALAVMAACAPRVPDSGAGFQDYQSYMRNSSASVDQGYNSGAQSQPWAGTQMTEQPANASSGRFDPAAASAALDRMDGSGQNPSTFNAPSQAPVFVPPASQGSGSTYLDPNRPRGDAPTNIQVQSGEMNGRVPAKVSDENDFSAVAARETISSDAERIARNRSQYVVVEPKSLPQRTGNGGPNIVQYALATTHNPGTQLYSRGGLFTKDVNVACAKFASPDLAQEAFLAQGGPDRDRLGVDPDGDGFACGWDPRPFRTALR